MKPTAHRILATIIGLWIISVAVGAFAVWRRWCVVQEHSDYIATRPMPKNRRLREGDFASPQIGVRGLSVYLPRREEFLKNKYLRHAVDQNDPIRPRDLADHPV